MGVLARRFLNLIVPGSSPGVKFLRRIDLTRQQLFHRVESAPPPRRPPYEPPPAGGAGGAGGGGQDAAIPSSSSLEKMETVRFAGPRFTFRALSNDWKMDCFPLADYSECKVVCSDESGRGFVFDLDSPEVGTIPPLRKPRVMMPISVFVHKPHVDGNVHDHGNGSCLFLMEKAPQPEARFGGDGYGSRSVLRGGTETATSDQFVGFIKQREASAGKSWHCHLLPPPPPFVRETCHWSSKNRPQITAYGVVGGGSHVCISVDGVGTYCLDTERLTWSQVGFMKIPKFPKFLL